MPRAYGLFQSEFRWSKTRSNSKHFGICGCRIRARCHEPHDRAGRGWAVRCIPRRLNARHRLQRRPPLPHSKRADRRGFRNCLVTRINLTQCQCNIDIVSGLSRLGGKSAVVFSLVVLPLLARPGRIGTWGRQACRGCRCLARTPNGGCGDRIGCTFSDCRLHRQCCRATAVAAKYGILAIRTFYGASDLDRLAERTIAFALGVFLAGLTSRLARAVPRRSRGHQWMIETRRPSVARYLPFQFGVRLLRKASMPSRKSSLI